MNYLESIKEYNGKLNTLYEKDKSDWTLMDYTMCWMYKNQIYSATNMLVTSGTYTFDELASLHLDISAAKLDADSAKEELDTYTSEHPDDTL